MTSSIAIPVLENTTFPVLVDPDLESPRSHVFVVNQSIQLEKCVYIHALLDEYSMILEYDTESRNLKLTSTPLEVDVVHPTMYTRLRSTFEYDAGPDPKEACVVGPLGPEGADAYFLPTFGATGPIVPYMFQHVIPPASSECPVNKIIIDTPHAN